MLRISSPVLVATCNPQIIIRFGTLMDWLCCDQLGILEERCSNSVTITDLGQLSPHQRSKGIPCVDASYAMDVVVGNCDDGQGSGIDGVRRFVVNISFESDAYVDDSECV